MNIEEKTKRAIDKLKILKADVLTHDKDNKALIAHIDSTIKDFERGLDESNNVK